MHTSSEKVRVDSHISWNVNAAGPTDYAEEKFGGLFQSLYQSHAKNTKVFDTDHCINDCIQDTQIPYRSSRTLGLAAAFSPSASREQRYLARNTIDKDESNPT